MSFNSKSFNPNTEDLKLIDDYLANSLDAAGMAVLEDRLRKSESLRQFFVEYSALDTNLHLVSQSQKSLADALQQVELVTKPAAPTKLNIRSWWWAVAGSLLLVSLVGLSWFTLRTPPAVAWILNAQNCDWDQTVVARGQFVKDQTIEIDRGLLEIGFDSQARVLIEGPAKLTVLSGRRVQLLSGNVAVKMPKGLSGFEVLTPSGRILDLGTEFGVSVAADGQVDVKVFDGEVMAFAGATQVGQKLLQSQSAHLQDNQIELDPPREPSFVRAILPPPIRVPNTFQLDFSSRPESSESAALDQHGESIGLKRLHGTGEGLAHHDENLSLDLERGVLRVQATRSDINFQKGLDRGEYFGLPLSQLGFTGREDFEIRMQVLDTPNLEGYGQYGIYVADNTKQCIRGGVIRWTDPQEYTQFLVNTADGRDHDANQLGYISPGSDVEICFRRMDGKFSLEVRDLTNENSNTLQIRHPVFLDNCQDFQVGIFVSNPFHDQHATVTFDSFAVTVWQNFQPEPQSAQSSAR